jgi:hypothetical protein
MEKSKFYWINAKPNRDGKGFVATYGAPGLSPGTVRDEQGQAIGFPNETLAKYAAAEKLIDVLNALPALARKSGKKPEAYKKLSGPDFAEAMADAEVGPTALAYLLAQNLQRIQEWVAGIDDKGNPSGAPHMARLLLAIFKEFPETFDFAMDITESVVSERRPRENRVRREPIEIDTTPK